MHNLPIWVACVVCQRSVIRIMFLNQRNPLPEREIHFTHFANLGRVCQRSVKMRFSPPLILSGCLAFLLVCSNLQGELLHVNEVIHVFVHSLSDEFGCFCAVLLFPLLIPFGLSLSLLLLPQSAYASAPPKTKGFCLVVSEKRRCTYMHPRPQFLGVDCVLMEALPLFKHFLCIHLVLFTVP